MIDSEELEAYFPYPIKIEHGMCYDDDDMSFLCLLKRCCNELLDNHNKKYNTKVERESIGWFSYPEEDGILENNEFRISVGSEVVQFGIFPDACRFEDFKDAKAFYKKITSIAESIMSVWHDKIIKIQEANKRTLEKYKADQYDEMVYAYYFYRTDDKHTIFLYLKRLAERYPNSRYMKACNRQYRILFKRQSPYLSKSTRSFRRKDGILIKEDTDF